MFRPTPERFRRFGCAFIFIARKKQIGSIRYVSFLASIDRLKPQFPNSNSQINQKVAIAFNGKNIG
jgi:hypothetical protein